MRKMIAVMALVAGLGGSAFAAGASSFEIGKSTGTRLVLVSSTQATLWGIEVDTGKIGDALCCYNAGAITGIVAATCQEGSIVDNSLALDSSKLAQIVVTGGLDSMKIVATAPSITPRNAARGLVCGATATTIQGRIIYQQP